MFGNRKEVKPKLAIENKLVESKATEQSAHPETIIRSDTELHGDMIGSYFRIEGSLAGNIGTEQKPAQRVVVDKHAQITGNIHASEVDVSGWVKGHIVVGRVILKESARIIGNINYNELITQAGALISGGLIPADESGMNGPAVVSGEVLGREDE
jgi:cytoskeletal protein CcmA (bactofilin family)